MAQLEAVIFDQDGVIAVTERDGHRVAFNRAFQRAGISKSWDVAHYGELLKISGGKERLRSEIADDQTVKDLHKLKTDIFMQMLVDGEMALRPGVARLVRQAHEQGLKLAVCSTSNERAVNTLVRTLLGADVHGWFDAILAGDVVTQKKPSPQIYQLALERLSLAPTQCVVIEDSRNGLLAAKGAELPCVITQNVYTAHEDFSAADLVVDCLGDPQGPAATVIAARVPLPRLQYVTLEHLQMLI